MNRRLIGCLDLCLTSHSLMLSEPTKPTKKGGAGLSWTDPTANQVAASRETLGGVTWTRFANR